jgi:hypothetical protein
MPKVPAFCRASVPQEGFQPFPLEVQTEALLGKTAKFQHL